MQDHLKSFLFIQVGQADGAILFIYLNIAIGEIRGDSLSRGVFAAELRFAAISFEIFLVSVVDFIDRMGEVEFIH